MHARQKWLTGCILILALLLGAACRPRQTGLPTLTPAQPATPTPTEALPAATPTPVTHVVQPGESLSGIAQQYRVPIEALAEANGITDPNLIQVGQRLVIPGPTPVPTMTVPPTVTPTPDIPPQLEIVEVIGRGAPSAEVVVIVNRGTGLSLEGWTLRDAQGNAFVFPNLYLGPGGELRVHTAAGENAPQHLYWNRDQPVWGEAGDMAVLADPRGVMHAAYPLN